MNIKIDADNYCKKYLKLKQQTRQTIQAMQQFGNHVYFFKRGRTARVN